MKERNINLTGFMCLMVAVAFIIVMCLAIDQTQKRYEEAQHNIDSLSRANRALIEQQREAQLKTIEDSIHFYEDGY